MASQEVKRAWDTKVGKGPVGGFGIALLTIVFAAEALLAVYGMMAFWPIPQPNGTADANVTEAANVTVRALLFGNEIIVDMERDMLLMVGFAGAAGAMAYVLRSFMRYVGERHLLWSWVPTYLMTPIVGALMAIITYIVFRAGLITGAGVATANPFGFAAIGTLVGLFSGQAAEKLKQVFETLFTATQAGGESIASAQPPAIDSFAPEEGVPGEVVLVRGTGLEAAETVTFGGDAPSTAEWDEESKALRTTVPDEATDGKLSVTIESETTTSVKTFKVLRPAAGEAKDDADAHGSEIDGDATTETAKVDDADASAEASKASDDGAQSGSGDAQDDLT